MLANQTRRMFFQSLVGFILEELNKQRKKLSQKPHKRKIVKVASSLKTNIYLNHSNRCSYYFLSPSSSRSDRVHGRIIPMVEEYLGISRYTHDDIIESWGRALDRDNPPEVVERLLSSTLPEARYAIDEPNTLNAYLNYVLHNYPNISEHWRINILQYLAVHLGYEPLPDYAFKCLGVEPKEHGIVNDYLAPTTLALPKFIANKSVVRLYNNQLMNNSGLFAIFTGKYRKIFYGILDSTDDTQELQLLAYSTWHEKVKSVLFGKINREQIVSIQSDCYEFELEQLKNYFHCFILWLRA